MVGVAVFAACVISVVLAARGRDGENERGDDSDATCDIEFGSWPVRVTSLRGNTFRVKLGGRDAFNSVERAFVRLCSRVFEIELRAPVVKGELFGIDLDGMWPLGGLAGRIGGKTAAFLGGDNGEGCALGMFVWGFNCAGRGVGRGGCGTEDAVLLDLGGD